MTARAYLGICRVHVIRHNQYRVSAISNVASVLFYGFIQTSILIAFYYFGDSGSIAMTVGQAVSYAWLSQALHSISPVFEEGELRQRISDGGFVYDLCRPLDLYGHWFARILAFRITPLLLYLPFVGLPALLFPGAYRMFGPDSLVALLAFFAAVASAVLMSTAVSALLAIMQIRIELGRGPVTLLMFVISFLSGGEVPLPILPDAVVRVIRLLPFAGIFDTPCSLYLGLIPASSAAIFLLRQLLWTGVLVLSGRMLLRINMRRVVVQGG
jgi:ABC-2 type transport system permease protein